MKQLLSAILGLALSTNAHGTIRVEFDGPAPSAEVQTQARQAVHNALKSYNSREHAPYGPLDLEDPSRTCTAVFRKDQTDQEETWFLPNGGGTFDLRWSLLSNPAEVEKRVVHEGAHLYYRYVADIAQNRAYSTYRHDRNQTRLNNRLNEIRAFIFGPDGAGDEYRARTAELEHLETIKNRFSPSYYTQEKKRLQHWLNQHIEPPKLNIDETWKPYRP